jgi:hypothetical protein
MHAYVQTLMHAWTNACIHSYSCKQTHVYAHVYTYVHTHTHVHTYTHLNSYTHTNFDMGESKLGFRGFLQWASSYITWFLSMVKVKPSSVMLQNVIFLSVLCCCHITINIIFIIIISSYFSSSFFPSARYIIPFLTMVMLYSALSLLFTFSWLSSSHNLFTDCWFR